MDIFTWLLLIIVIILIISSNIFPGINFFTLFNPGKKYFIKATLSDNQLLLIGFRKQVIIPLSDIRKLSMGPFSLRSTVENGIFAVQIDTNSESFYLFQSSFNFFAPALKRDLIKQMLILNPNIELDNNLAKYTNESLADMYINKDQIKRGLLVILFLFALFIITNLLSYIKKLLGK
jgi:hypothetical protein